MTWTLRLTGGHRVTCQAAVDGDHAPGDVAGVVVDQELEPFDAIAQQVGYQSRGNAHRAYEQAMGEVTVADVTERPAASAAVGLRRYRTAGRPLVGSSTRS